MFSKIFLSIFTILIFHHYSVLSLPKYDAKLDQVQGANPRLVSLGIINGKQFFMDNSMRRIWKDAKEFAAALNMELADISSVAESEFLNGVSFDLLPLGGYWTAGRDRGGQSQYIWDTTLKNVSSHSMNWSTIDDTIRSCVLFGVSSGRRILHGTNCLLDYYVIMQQYI